MNEWPELTPQDRGRPRKIIHADADAFFASVEVRDNPKLKGQALAVAWKGPRSVVTTATYEARKYGVRSAMPLRTALARCPHLLVVEPRMDAYREASRLMQGVFLEYTDLVEPLSLDEAYLDVTHPRQGGPSATRIAQHIKREVHKRTDGLTVTAGVSSSKFVAKLASSMNKPDGLTVIVPEQVDELVAKLPVSDFYGIGPKTAERMATLGVRTGADLRRVSLQDLLAHFGKSGEHYYQIARGIDERPVDPRDDRKSVGAEETFDQDEGNLEKLHLALAPIAGRVQARLARHALAGRVVTLKVKFHSFELLTRRVTLPVPVKDAREVLRVASTLLTEELLAGRPVRLLGISVSALEDENGSRTFQLPLFELF
ncbi:DNA polymerase IV [Deinococcus peraridilitoris]|uniref:DNA polymerase IV n=1 Tax=Deinococcus peraridilitoris (strain DSM 19664 / LMG 22246 / CIP 109416 / KR-200) TaxID=937777 RepID=L0A245_DEIPD|nr:DNA polymerase IV [Deinococcus peraridilitoris]AFZ67242.1 nucleotidyltransferase/DNA polymerase involved in DNA repair [Deinococcus peraridilitoris DSM 19664]